MTLLGKIALALATKGMRVFPCVERSKEPAIHDNLKRATTDPNIIAGWWSTRDFNVAIATGPGSGIWAVDIDGDEGEDTLRKLEAAFGPLPPTIEAITGKGRHSYFRWPTGTEIRNSQLRQDLLGLEWRGDGGYVLAPPSIHPSGRRYAWSVDSVDEFADAPEWLLELVTGKSRNNGAPMPPAATRENWRTFLGDTHDGSHRGHAIARFSGLLLRKYVDPLIVLDTVRLLNAQRCQPPLDDDEVVRIVTDITRREQQERRSRRL
jgi:bifunctional DNA primase/polymerase-like protein/primase-like protein